MNMKLLLSTTTTLLLAVGTPCFAQGPASPGSIPTPGAIQPTPGVQPIPGAQPQPIPGQTTTTQQNPSGTNQAGTPSSTLASSDGELTGFAHRAAIAHVVYSPDVRRPVEVGADQEQALVTWLSKRMGTAVKPPSLAGLGYELIGGRLLPGDKGPVAQFMYGAAGGQRLTLYVTREVPGQDDTAFKFGKDGPVNVFYWVEDHFGYAISAGADRALLMKVSQEVYRQLKPR